MNVSGGMTLTLTNFRMKLFTSIAAATAVIGTSFIASTPAEARNGWVKGGESDNGEVYYVKILNRNGQYVTYLERYSEDDDELRMIADCSGWQYREYNESKWLPALPGSIGEANIEIVCR